MGKLKGQSPFFLGGHSTSARNFSKPIHGSNIIFLNIFSNFNESFRNCNKEIK
jgi:hypothetical protein